MAKRTPRALTFVQQEALGEFQHQADALRQSIVHRQHLCDETSSFEVTWCDIDRDAQRSRRHERAHFRRGCPQRKARDIGEQGAGLDFDHEHGGADGPPLWMIPAY
jgi:hypothetical protein